MTDPREECRAYLAGLGLPAERLAHMDVLERLLMNLRAANERTNLTRLTDDRDYWLLHVADSVSVAAADAAILREPLEIADVGAGAGFPTLVLAWANPAATMTAVEPRGRKAQFIADQAERLGLANVRVEAAQVKEAARQEEHRGRYDRVLLRAVGEAGKFAGPCARLLKDAAEAAVIFYKTPEAVEAELPGARREAAKAGMAVGLSDVLDLPGEAGRRQFLAIGRGLEAGWHVEKETQSGGR